jgi:hypothetical protein
MRVKPGDIDHLRSGKRYHCRSSEGGASRMRAPVGKAPVTLDQVEAAAPRSMFILNPIDPFKRRGSGRDDPGPLKVKHLAQLTI